MQGQRARARGPGAGRAPTRAPARGAPVATSHDLTAHESVPALSAPDAVTSTVPVRRQPQLRTLAEQRFSLALPAARGHGSSARSEKNRRKSLRISRFSRIANRPKFRPLFFEIRASPNIEKNFENLWPGAIHSEVVENT